MSHGEPNGNDVAPPEVDHPPTDAVPVMSCECDGDDRHAAPRSGARTDGLWQSARWAPTAPSSLGRTVAACPAVGPCLICGEPVPNVTYVWSGGRVANLHAAWGALW